MNAFANWLFGLLLGWTSSMANNLMNRFSDSGGAMAGLFSRLWLPAVVIMLAGGTLADLIAWFVVRRSRRTLYSEARDRQSDRRTEADHRVFEAFDIPQEDTDLLAHWAASPIAEDPYAPFTASSPAEPFLIDANYPPVGFEETPGVLAEGELPWPNPPSGEYGSFEHQTHDSYSPPSATGEEAIYDAPASQGGFPYQRAVLPMNDSAPSLSETPVTQPLAWYPPYDSSAPNDGSSLYLDAVPEVGAQEFQHIEVPPPPPAVRRRRADAHRRRNSALKQAVESLKDKLSGTEDDEAVLEGLPPPIPQHEAFMDPVYPDEYHYLEPPALPPMDSKQ